MLVGICGLAGSGKDTSGDFLVEDHGFVKVAFADPLKRICLDVYQFTEEQLWGPSPMRNAPDKRYPRKHTWQPSNEGDGESCLCCGATRSNTLLSGSVAQCYLTPRYALQQLGTEWGRDNYDPTWVEYAVRVYGRLQAGGCVYDRVTGLRTVSYVDTPGPDGKTLVRGRKDVAITDVRFLNEVAGLREHGAKLLRVIRPEAGLKGVAGAHRSETEQGGMKDSMFDRVIVNDGTLGELKVLVDDFVRSVT